MAELWAHVAQHLTLAGAALALALLAGLPLGVLAAESAGLRGGVLALAGVGRTLPSLAVLMLVLLVRPTGLFGRGDTALE